MRLSRLDDNKIATPIAFEHALQQCIIMGHSNSLPDFPK